MRKLDQVQLGEGRIRVSPWRGDQTTAYVAPMPGLPLPTDAVRACASQLRRDGYRRAVTAALGSAEQRPFLQTGWEVLEQLHLLRHDLVALPASSRHVVHRRGRWSDRPAMLAVDAAAFEPFWRFDASGLADARRATPQVRVRVIDGADGLAAYAICGRSGPTSYLQRLAVHPGHESQGLGSALVVDALMWSRRRSVSAMLVNTQDANDRALALYERLGFQQQPNGLAVLGTDLQP